LASRRIRRTKSIAGYLESLNQESSESRLRNNARSIASEAIGSSALSEEVQILDKAIQSENYAPGADGWRIDGGGNAEFGNVYVRGDINAYSGTIGYWNISNPLVERSFGTTTLYGTFLESFDHGPTDADATTGSYVALFKSYFDDPTTFTAVKLESNKVTLTLTGHTLSVGDPIIVKFDSATYVDLQSANNDTFTVTDTTPTTVSYFLPSYNASGASDIALTDAAGTVQIFYEDVAGLYLQDYERREFDYAWFSNKGVTYRSAATLNLVKNAGAEWTYFDTVSESNVTEGSTSGWSVTGGITLASYTYVSNIYDSRSSYAIVSGWTSAYSSAYLSAGLSYATAKQFGLTDRVLGFGFDMFHASTPAQKAVTSANIYTQNITNSARSGTTVTLTVGTHGFQVDDVVTIAGVTTAGRTSLNEADVTITSITSTQIVYTSVTSGTLTSAATNGNVTAYEKILVTTSTAHGYAANDYVITDFDLIDVDLNGYLGSGTGTIQYAYKVDAVIASTTFVFSPLMGPLPSLTLTARLLDDGATARTIAVYKQPWVAYDLRQIRFKFSNGTTVNLIDVLTAGSADLISGKEIIGHDPFTYIDRYYNYNRTLAPMAQFGSSSPFPLELDMSALVDAYITNDPAGELAGSDISIQFPGWIYSESYATFDWDIATHGSTKIAISGFYIDDVYLTAENRPFSGVFYDPTDGLAYSATGEEGATGLLTEARTPDYPSYLAGTTWIDIDLANQNFSLTHVDYLSLTAGDFTKQFFAEPGLFPFSQASSYGVPDVLYNESSFPEESLWGIPQVDLSGLWNSGLGTTWQTSSLSGGVYAYSEPITDTIVYVSSNVLQSVGDKGASSKTVSAKEYFDELTNSNAYETQATVIAETWDNNNGYKSISGISTFAVDNVNSIKRAAYATVSVIGVTSDVSTAVSMFKVKAEKINVNDSGNRNTGITTVDSAEWNLSSYTYRRNNGMVFASITIRRKGGDFGPDADGNITNQSICTFPVGFRPPFSTGSVLTSSGGLLFTGYVTSGGVLILSNMEAGTTIGDEDTVTVSVMFPTDGYQ
jgi:hypothetical protein